MPRHQLVPVLVLCVDARSLLESQAVLWRTARRTRVAQAVNYLQLFHRTISCRTRLRVQLQVRTSPALQAFIHHLPTMPSVLAARLSINKKCSEEFPSFWAPVPALLRDKRFRRRCVLDVVRQLLVHQVDVRQHDLPQVVSAPLDGTSGMPGSPTPSCRSTLTTELEPGQTGFRSTSAAETPRAAPHPNLAARSETLFVDSWWMRFAISVLVVVAISFMADVAVPAGRFSTNVVEEQTRGCLASNPNQRSR